MKRAFDVAVADAAFGERCSSVGAQIRDTTKLSGVVPEQDQVLAESADCNKLTGLDLL